MTYTDEFMGWLGQADLTDRTKAAVLLRSDGLTLRAAGEMLNVGPERIRQMCRKAEIRFSRRHVAADGRRRIQEEMDARQDDLAQRRAAPWEFWTASELELSVRSNNLMRSEGLTLGDVAAMSDAELLRIPNFGRKSLNELRAVVAEARGDSEVQAKTAEQIAVDCILAKYAPEINNTPFLLSLLYDLDLLPEQVRNMRDASAMAGICIAYAEGRKAAA